MRDQHSPNESPPPGEERLSTDDMLEHLRLLIEEEAPLWEVPSESTIVGPDAVVRTGPWDAAACSRVLLRWLDAGLIGVYRASPEPNAQRDLDDREAYLALSRFEMWQPSAPMLCLFATETGAAQGDDVWLRALEAGENRG